MTDLGSHDLIDTYFKKPWHVRVGFFFLKVIVLVVVLALAAW